MLICKPNLPILPLNNSKPILIIELYLTILALPNLIPPLIIPLAILHIIPVLILDTVFSLKHFHLVTL